MEVPGPTLEVTIQIAHRYAGLTLLYSDVQNHKGSVPLFVHFSSYILILTVVVLTSTFNRKAFVWNFKKMKY